MTTATSGQAAAPDLTAVHGAPALAFRLGGRDLAAFTASGCGVVEIDSWTRVPTAPKCVLGIANAQGRMLTVLDLRAELGLPQQAWRMPLQALALGDSEPRVAVAIDRALGFGSHVPVEAQGEQAATEGLAGYGLGSIDIAGRRATLVDFSALLDTLRASARNRTQLEGQTT